MLKLKMYFKAPELKLNKTRFYCASSNYIRAKDVKTLFYRFYRLYTALDT